MRELNLKWIILGSLSLIWGSSFILIKMGLIGLNPYQLGSLRIIFCAFFLLLIGFKSLTKIPSHKWKYIALTAVFGTFIPGYLFALAETKVSSSICSILNSLTPLNTLVIGAFVFSLDFRRNQITGILVGLIGTLILILNGNTQATDDDYTFSFLVLIATVCYATNVNLIKKYLSDVNPLSISTGNFLIMLFPAIGVLFYNDFSSIMIEEKVQTSMWYILILGVVCTGIANIIFFKLIHISSPVFASSVTYLIPIIAFMWGILDGEVVMPLQFLGASIILAGVYLANKK